MLIDELKKANIEAMKNKEKDRRAILSVVITRYQLRLVEAKAQNKELNHKHYRVGDKNDVRQYFIGKNQNSVSYFIFLKKPHGFLI